YFTPFDYFPMWGGDLDLGSGAQVLLPDQPGTYPHLLVGCGKEGTIYLVNRDNMGHLTSSTTSDPQIVQEIPNAVGNVNNPEHASFSSPVYWQNHVYFGGVSDNLKAFQLSNGLLSTSPVSKSAVSFGFPGASPAVSANGSVNGILWAVQNDAW